MPSGVEVVFHLGISRAVSGASEILIAVELGKLHVDGAEVEEEVAQLEPQALREGAGGGGRACCL